jgi:hypothetical protein
MAACSSARLFFGRNILGIKIGTWSKGVFFPLVIMTCISSVIGLFIVNIISEQSFVRICITSAVTCLSMFVLAWFFLFDNAERTMLRNVYIKAISKIRKNK